MRSLRHRNRLREVESEKIERLREEMSFSWKDIASLLGVGTKQVKHYRACGRLPADRFYAARDALLLDVEDRAREERERILKLFSSTPLV